MHREGAQLAFTYQNDKLKTRVENAAAEYGSNIVIQLDVGDYAEIDTCFAKRGKHWDGFDILFHSIGFAPREVLEADYLDGLDRESFRNSHDISTSSLHALAKAALP